MGMPSISITFTEVAATAIQRGERGIIAMIIKESTVPENPVVSCQSATDVPTTLSAFNQTQMKLALKGYVNIPRMVVAYIIPSLVSGYVYSEVSNTTGKNPANEGWYELVNADYVLTEDTEPEEGKAYYTRSSQMVSNTDYTDGLNYWAVNKFDYLVIPTVGTDGKTSDVVSWIRAQRENNRLVKAVLPNTNADNEAIVNYATPLVYEGDVSYTTEQYCSRIAGIIAGTPLDIACTYAPLFELTDCTRLTKSEMDDAVDAGKLIVWWDGEKVKIARAVNSLVTLTSRKNTQFQKIKILDAMDMMATDIQMTAEDNYLGKYPNNYDNKCLLLSAIQEYFRVLQNEQVVNSYEIGFDIDAIRGYLEGRGVDTSEMSEDDLKQASTGSKVFLSGKLEILDAMEDIYFPISI